MNFIKHFVYSFVQIFHFLSFFYFPEFYFLLYLIF